MQTQIKSRPQMQFVVLDANSIRRVREWYERLCPSCHCIGRVGIYPNREAESMQFIARREWVCRRCENIRDEVNAAFVARGLSD
ncbi:MAG: hypothetical protein HY257_04685 [Chloroflexi bacterium]|nr:hypothetical protein [Chloroflexota bacterium]